MKKYIFIVVFFIISLSLLANRQDEYDHLYSLLVNNENLINENLDSIISYKGYKVCIIENGGNIEFIGLNLFNDEVKNAIDKEMLDFVETALLAKVLDQEINGNTKFLFYGGDIKTFKEITPETVCRINNNSKYLSFEYEIKKGRIFRMEVPIFYEKAKGGSRSEIENNFIDRIKKVVKVREERINIDSTKLISYGNNKYVLLGSTYLNNEITRNLYFTFEEKPSLIYDKDFPVESIANLFIYPLDEKGIIEIELTILKHNYGEKETFNVGLENFLSVCESEGCIPYWGVESFDGKTLVGSLFLNNWEQGYNHVLKMTCKPEQVIAGREKINALASLFIPANNITSLYGEDDLTIIR